IRTLEDMDRISDEQGGNLYLVNGNMLPLSMAGAFADTKEDTSQEKSDEEQEVLAMEKPDRRRVGTKNP
ncbi:MAG: phage portal protein, partial [Spirochaetia bacterium]|nr:phage portal protein [Spirochaetia bacterium]